MSRSSYDFNFEHAWKPCEDKRKEKHCCIDDAYKECPYFQMCDLAIKYPPLAPTVDWRTVSKLTFG